MVAAAATAVAAAAAAAACMFFLLVFLYHTNVCFILLFLGSYHYISMTQDGDNDRSQHVCLLKYLYLLLINLQFFLGSYHHRTTKQADAINSEFYFIHFFY